MDAQAFTAALGELTNMVQCRVAPAVDAAAKRPHAATQAERVGQKQHLRSLKSSCINLGQKLMFAEAVERYQPSHGQTLRADADKAAAAVETAEDELKDWKAMTRQEDLQVQATLSSISSCHAEFQALLGRMQQKLEALAKQEAAQQHAQAALDQVLATSMGGKERVSDRLAAEAARATQLEAQLASARSQALQDEMNLASEQSQLAIVQDAVKELQRTEQAEAQEAAQAEALRSWSRYLAGVTGVQQATWEQDGDTVHVVLCGRGGDMAQGKDHQVHELHVRVAPGTRTAVSDAALSPPTVDVTEAVRAARARGHDGLSVLVSAVLLQLDAHV